MLTLTYGVCKYCSGCSCCSGPQNHDSATLHCIFFFGIDWPFALSFRSTACTLYFPLFFNNTLRSTSFNLSVCFSHQRTTRSEHTTHSCRPETPRTGLDGYHPFKLYLNTTDHHRLLQITADLSNLPQITKSNEIICNNCVIAVSEFYTVPFPAVVVFPLRWSRSLRVSVPELVVSTLQ